MKPYADKQWEDMLTTCLLKNEPAT
jgi:hypothetical protein